ncbi:hypothetical protein ACQ5RK_07235 [Latilactobacillus curvatus]
MTSWLTVPNYLNQSSVDWVLFRTKIERAGGTDSAFGLTEDGDYQYKTAKGLF